MQQEATPTPKGPTYSTQPLMRVLRTGTGAGTHAFCLVCSFRGRSTRRGRSPPPDTLWSFFPINKHLMQRQFTTNIWARGILWRLKSTEICFRSGLCPGPRWGIPRRYHKPPSRKPPPYCLPRRCLWPLGLGASNMSTSLFTAGDVPDSEHSLLIRVLSVAEDVSVLPRTVVARYINQHLHYIYDLHYKYTSVDNGQPRQLQTWWLGRR